MNRAEYLQLRTSNVNNLIYMYYLEHHKFGETLDIQKFSQYFNAWIRSHMVNDKNILDTVLKYYDEKFNAVILYDESNKVLKIY